MTDRLVPLDARRAAARAGIRTAAQSLAGGLPSGGIALALTGDYWLAVGLGAASAVATAIIAGGAAYLDTLAKGVPSDYATESDAA